MAIIYPTYEYTRYLSLYLKILAVNNLTRMKELCRSPVTSRNLFGFTPVNNIVILPDIDEEDLNVHIFQHTISHKKIHILRINGD